MQGLATGVSVRVAGLRVPDPSVPTRGVPSRHLSACAAKRTTSAARSPPDWGRAAEMTPRASTSANLFPNRSRAGQTGVSRVPGSRRLSPPSASGPRRTTRHKCNARPGQIEAACFARARARSPELTALFVVRGGRRGGACLLRRCERPQPGHCRRGVSRHPLLASQLLCATTSAASTRVD